MKKKLIILLLILSGCVSPSEKKEGLSVVKNKNEEYMNNNFKQLEELSGNWHSEKWNTKLKLIFLEDNKIQVLFNGNTETTTLESYDSDNKIWRFSSDKKINYMIGYKNNNSISFGQYTMQTSEGFSDGTTEIVEFTRVSE